jgi:hypothetical protein
MLTYAKYDILKSILKFEIQIKIAFHFYISISLSHEGQNPPFFGYCLPS